MACKGICSRFEATAIVTTGRYANGQKRCRTCSVFIRWSGLRCPCCGHRLRTRPRNIKYKRKMMKQLQSVAQLGYRLVVAPESTQAISDGLNAAEAIPRMNLP